WTTTPWTLTSNVAAAVGPALRYVRVRQDDDQFWLAKGTLKTALEGPFEVLEERAGSEMVGWRYAGPFDDLAAVRTAFATGTRDDPEHPYRHVVIPWNEVGEDEGTGIVHIAPGCGAEDFQLGKALGLPVIAPLDEAGIFVDGFGNLSGSDVRDVADPIVEHLKRTGRFYRLETITHRYPHCWRCGTPLVFRLVDEWFISMGPLYDQPRETLTREQVDASLRYQIMEVVDQIRWIPDFGYDRELDWLRNMHDWMISKKRYWGLALPIYDCSACGTVEVIGGREELRERAVEGWDAFAGHTPHRPYVDAVKIACPGCGAPVERIKDVGNPWLDAGIVPFSTLHYREDPDYWRQWFPADFITESFPGQFRNWFYSMLAMSTVLRREPPFKTIFGYALVFAEDGRQMHKSWGNAIEFDEAADRMGVDVMRWMFAKARPEENILFGWHAADEARRELLILWNVYSFFVTYARLAGWTPSEMAPPIAERPVLDRWILSRAAGTAAVVQARLLEVDALAAARALSAYLDGLSTWYLRLSRRRFSRSDDATDRAAAFATLHEALVAAARMLAPILPFFAESLYANLVTTVTPDAPDSVHLTRWPSGELAHNHDEALETAMAIAQGAVELARTLRSTAHIRTRQPLATAWIALPDRGLAIDDALLRLIADEINVKEVILIEDDSALVDRRVKPLLPRIGKRLGSAIPAVMAAARAGDVTFEGDGSVTLAGVKLAADEVEVQATPRPGTAVAHHDGLVVVLDTGLSPELVAEGDARELARAIQELRREAGLELDDRIELWVKDAPSAVAAHLPSVAVDTLAELASGEPPSDAVTTTVELGGGPITIALRRRAAARTER
ncbi:MAG: isoleucyl-tRNA synthetase, partial [Chloroflexota bacterium]|nr:isoleucyl-tRNA synthetase [Chloroflexota bacterium]